MKLLASLTALLQAGVLATENTDPNDLLRVENGVLVCNAQHWDDCVGEQRFSLVCFNSSNEKCKGCASATALTEKVAKELKSQTDLTVASFDCEGEKNAAVCGRLRVPGVPALLLLDHGRPLRWYRGPQSASDVARWAQTHMKLPVASLTSAEQLKQLQQEHRTLLVVASDEASDGRLAHVANMLRDVDLDIGVAAVSVADAAKLELQLSKTHQSLVLGPMGTTELDDIFERAFRDDGREAMKELLGRVIDASFGPLDELNASTASKFAARSRPLIVLIGEPESQNFRERARALKALTMGNASLSHLSFAWLHPDSNFEVTKRLRSQRQHFAESAEIYALTHDMRWHFDGDDADLRSWLTEWKPDPETAILASEPEGQFGDYVDDAQLADLSEEFLDTLEEEQRKLVQETRLNPLLKLRSSTWPQLLATDGELGAFDQLRSRDRLVLLCDLEDRLSDVDADLADTEKDSSSESSDSQGACRAALDEFRQLALHFGPSVSADHGVAVGFMDTGLNELRDVQATAAPTVLFMPAGTYGADVVSQVPVDPADPDGPTVERTHKDFLVYRDTVVADDLITFVCSLGQRVDEDKSCVVEVALKPGEEPDAATMAMLEKLYEDEPDPEEEDEDTLVLEEVPVAEFQEAEVDHDEL